jgi:hypothetical protein
VLEDTAARCLHDAGLAADDVTYLETHGTGTELGDPIELKALANALRRTSAENGYCAIGTKANVGHMEAASGVGSLIKVLLAMRHGQVAPCAKLRTVNSSFDHAQSPFYFPTKVGEWARNARGTRVAGINSFGMGGSNAFVVVESAPQTVSRPDAAAGPSLFVCPRAARRGCAPTRTHSRRTCVRRRTTPCLRPRSRTSRTPPRSAGPRGTAASPSSRTAAAACSMRCRASSTGTHGCPSASPSAAATIRRPATCCT